METPLTSSCDSTILQSSNARSVDASASVPQWVREYPMPDQLHKYLMERRRALLAEVAEIERILNVKPRVVRSTEL